MQIVVNNLCMKYYFPCGNGVGCFDGSKRSLAVIDNDGSKKVDTQANKNKIVWLDFPFLRGLQFFFCGLMAMLGCFDAGFSLANQEESKLSKKITKTFYISAKYFFILISVGASFVIAFFLLGFLPAKLSFLLIGNSANLRLRALIIALLKVLFMFLLLLLLRFLPSMQYFYRFNGAVNQIGNNLSKNSQNFKKNWHKPLNFVNFMIFALLFCIFMVSLIAVNINWWANLLINLAIVLGSISLCYELLNLLEVSGMEWVNNLCLITSWFVCMKPNITQEEIAKVAQLESERGSSKISAVEEGMIALSAVLTEMQTKLNSAGKFEKSDVDWIVATVLNKNRAEIKLIHAISNKDYREIMMATERRAKGEPLSSIFGFVEFYGLRFDVNRKVLTPRMETEILVDEALKQIKEKKFKEVCDLCTGSGAIAISIAKNVNAKVSAVDISKPALQIAEQNAKKNQVKIDFFESDLLSGLKKSKKFDIIVSNPPYIESGEIDKLDEEVKNFDPRIALDGGEDGLDFYRKIIEQSTKRLNKNGVLMFEIGATQATEVRKLLKNAGFVDTHVVKDYQKKKRVIYGKISN